MTYGRYSYSPTGSGRGSSSSSVSSWGSRSSGSGSGSGSGRLHPAGGGSPPRSGGKTVSVLGYKVPRRRCLSLLTAAAALMVLGPDLDYGFLSGFRSTMYATICIHNIYINSLSEALLMPAVPPVPATGYMPTHIQMCYEWLRRDAITTDWVEEKVSLSEHRDICLDWTAPHYAMLEIVSSSVMNTILPRIRYRHDCPDHREYEEALRGYDWSTFQTVFQRPAMAVDQDLVDPFRFEEQCKYCLATYTEAGDRARVRSRTLHHCFAFPKESTLYAGGAISLPPVSVATPVAGLPSQPLATGNVAPISSLVRPLRSRLLHSAIEWMNVTDPPDQEENSGTVILIDSGSYGVAPAVLDPWVSSTATSIAVLAGPLCYTATLPTGQRCVDYGNEIKAYFAAKYPSLNNPPSGFEGRPGVDFQISGSTAGTWSRAMLANELVCPPNTFSCLMPALGKQPPKTSTLLETTKEPPIPKPPEEGKPAPPAVDFFDKVGTNDNTNVVQLPDGDVPDIVEGTEAAPPPAPIPATESSVPVSPSFTESQLAVTTSDGYSPENTEAPPPAPVDLQAIAETDSATAIEQAAEELPPELTESTATDPNEPSPLTALENVEPVVQDTETVPTTEEVDAAVASGEPLNVNTVPETATDPETGETVPLDPTLSTELATDEASPLVQEPLTEQNYMDLAVERRDSKERIVTGVDKNYLFEVPCPTVENEVTGDVIIIENSYVLTNGTGGSENCIVSDSTGTVIFQCPVTVETIPIEEGPVTTIDPDTGETTTTTEKYTTFHDPYLDDDVVVTSSGVVTNPDSSLSVDKSVGTLVLDPQTQEGTLVLDGSATDLNTPESEQTHTIVSGTVLATGNENVPPTDSGTVVMEGESLAVTGTTGDDGSAFPGFNEVDPLVGNTGGYQQFAISDMESEVTRISPVEDNCLLDINELNNPMYITARDGTTVTFDTYQIFKGDEISWVAVDIPDATLGGEMTCIKINEVPTGKSTNTIINNPTDNMGYPRRKATCTNNKATVDVFIHDGSKKIGQAQGDITSLIPARCEPSQDYDNKCWFRYELNCGGGARLRRRLTGQQTQTRTLPQRRIQAPVQRGQAAPAAPQNQRQTPQRQQAAPVALFKRQQQQALGMTTPQKAAKLTNKLANIKWGAKAVLTKCPELGKKRTFDHFVFGESKRKTKMSFLSMRKKNAKKVFAVKTKKQE